MLILECERSDGSLEPVRLREFRCFCAGYTGRDRAAVDRHIEELERDLGVARPARVPTCYPMAARLVLPDPGRVEVYGGSTSGEVEPVLIVIGGRARYLTVGSDHTDRAQERHGIAEAKNLCPKVISGRAWAIEDVAGVWDSLELRSWSDGELYQQGRLDMMLRPDDLLACVPTDRLGSEAVVMGGTIPTLAGFRFGTRFEGSLRDPAGNRELRLAYEVAVLEAI